MNNQDGLEALLAIEGENRVLNALVESVLSESVILRAQVLAVVAAVAAYSTRGHSLVLKAFDSIQSASSSSPSSSKRFSRLLFLLNESKDWMDRANAMTLINAIISSPEDVRINAELRDEFVSSLRLLDTLKRIRTEVDAFLAAEVEAGDTEPNEHADIMRTQIDIFYEEMISDHQELVDQFPIYLIDLDDINEVILTLKYHYAHPGKTPS